MSGDVARYDGVLTIDTDRCAPDAAMAEDLGQDEKSGVARYREADALRAHDHGGVDADDPPARIDERAAGIAGVQRRIGLDDVVDQAAIAGAQRAANGAHHACGHRLLEAERIADGDRELSGF